MTYKKIITGGSFGPGHQFSDDRMQFQNCTFIADVKFGKHCDFINCTFVRCCPKPYNKISSVKEHARFFNCKLESVQVAPHAELYNTNKSGYLVTIMSPLPLRNITKKKGGESAIKTDSCGGQRITSKDVQKNEKFQECGPEKVQGYSDVKVKTSKCGCP